MILGTILTPKGRTKVIHFGNSVYLRQIFIQNHKVPMLGRMNKDGVGEAKI